MKLIPLLILLLIFATRSSCKVIYYDDLLYYPKEPNDLIEYGSLKLTRSKDKTMIYLKGNFSLLKSLGNEKLVALEFHNANAMMMRSVKPFCEFIRGETIFWPSIVKSSNMPRDNPCPFPDGDYSIQKFSIAFSKSLVQPLQNGKYTMNIIMHEAGKEILKFVVKFSLKRT